jgi:serine/threonine protein phosphatase PrpC
MTRALGHKFLQDYGVLYEPHVTHHRVTEDDHVLIVGSDGLFDVVRAAFGGGHEATHFDLPALFYVG